MEATPELLRLAKIGREVERARRRPRCNAAYCWQVKGSDIHKRPWGRKYGDVDNDIQMLTHPFLSKTKARAQRRLADKRHKKQMAKIFKDRADEAAKKAKDSLARVDKRLERNLGPTW